MLDANDDLIVAIVRGDDRASTSRGVKGLGTERPRTAEADAILDKTGYPCGGHRPLGTLPGSSLIPELWKGKKCMQVAGPTSLLSRYHPGNCRKPIKRKSSG